MSLLRFPESNSTALRRPGLRARPWRPEEDALLPSGGADLLLIPGRENARYRVGFAASEACLMAAQRLRFEVFNLELGEGLPGSFIEGLDRDSFDSRMTHIVLQDRATGAIVGTYRAQTAPHGLSRGGLYSAEEFDLSPLEPLFAGAVERGRACIAEGHRNLSALMLLWQGLGAFLKLQEARWLFGCCSITSRDPEDGWRVMKTLRPRRLLHPEFLCKARPACSCGSAELEFDPACGGPLPLPKLFGTYMKLGARVVSEPAIDRAFGTVDFLVMIDTRAVALSSLDIGG